jgi:hypothetical protein
MSDRTFEQAVHDWLEAGSDATPPAAVDAVLLAVKTTPQERDLRIPRRFSPMNSFMRLAAGVAIAAVAGVALLALINKTPGTGVGPTPTPGPTPTAAATASPAPTAAPSPTATIQPTAAPSVFTSPLYKYSISLPAGWTAYAALAPWDGKSSPANFSSDVDQVNSSTGTQAWVMAAPTTKTLATFLADQNAADAREHPCPVTPEIDEATTIDGKPARLNVRHCGILVVNAVVIDKGIGYLFYLQHPPEDTSNPEDVGMFRILLAGVKLP